MHQQKLAGRWLRHERWNQRVGAYSRLPALIRQLGADPEPILCRSGISAEAIARPEGRVPYQALVTLLQEVASETACPHLGLLAGACGASPTSVSLARQCGIRQRWATRCSC